MPLVNRGTPERMEQEPDVVFEKYHLLAVLVTERVIHQAVSTVILLACGFCARKAVAVLVRRMMANGIRAT